jgi:hypothetical protein
LVDVGCDDVTGDTEGISTVMSLGRKLLFGSIMMYVSSDDAADEDCEDDETLEEDLFLVC